MTGQVVQYGRHRKRRNYARISEVLELPDLIKIQTKSYEQFLREGLVEMFRDTSPIESFTGNSSLEFVDCRLGEPKYDLEESKDRDATYAAPLRIKVRLIIKETGEVKEQEVFTSDFPLTTNTDTFVINGAECVIVSQLVRSPSVYFSKKIDENGRENYDAAIIPSRDAWLEYEADAKDVVYVRIDRTRKLPLAVLLHALGFSSDQEIIDLLGDNEHLRNTLGKDDTENTGQALLEIHERLRLGEPPTVKNAKSPLYSHFFGPKRYDLASVGRYRANKKLYLKHRLFDQKLAEPTVSAETGEIVVEEGAVLDRRKTDEIMDIPESNTSSEVFELHGSVIDEPVEVRSIKVYVPNDSEGRTTTIIDNAFPDLEVKCITPADIIASIGYFFNLLSGIGHTDDIDHLSNHRLCSVGELLQSQSRIGLSRMERVVRERISIQDTESIAPQQLINIRPVIASIKEFFDNSQLSQFMDQTSPLAELTHGRHLSTLGPGGLIRERARVEMRNVHYSHYDRICPIKAPEGPNAGLINSLSSYACIDKFGFIETPYRKVDSDTHAITDQTDYLTADEEDSYVVTQANSKSDENGRFMDDGVVCCFRGNNTVMAKGKVDYMDVSPKQVVSTATACIPFLENDDSNRALIGTDMQRQAVPLMNPEAPFVDTDMEHVAARDSDVAITTKHRGRVEHVEFNGILVRRLVKENGVGHEGKLDRYPLAKFKRSNSDACYNQRPIVTVGDAVEFNEILADGPSTELGEMALGRNVVTGFMTQDGYNYGDAVIMSERLVKDDVYTSIHVEEYGSGARDTKLEPKGITRDTPNASESALENLDDRGIAYIGAEIKDGDILAGKVTPKGVTELTAEERLLHAISGEKTREVRDTSSRVPHGASGIVLDVRVFNREEGDDTLSPGVNQSVCICIVRKRRIHAGDKMYGRHSNKGVISRIVPEEDMPCLPDGHPVDIMLNPLSVPSRMDIGQVLELHLGMAAKNLGIHVASPVFDGTNDDDVWSTIKEAGMAHDGKTVLYDEHTDEPFDNHILVGVMYMLKLTHMVDDKLYVHSTRPYPLATQQPLGGKAQFGGQRFGEMEVWAFKVYGTAYTLQEILTYKSDGTVGHVKTYEAIAESENISRPSVLGSFQVLMKELQSLGLDVRVMDEQDSEIEMTDVDNGGVVEHKVDLQQGSAPEAQREVTD